MTEPDLMTEPEPPMTEPDLMTEPEPKTEIADSAGTWAVIAGGGTAGHVLAGLSIAQEIVARGAPPGAVHYVGSSRGAEERLVGEAGFGLTALPGRGIQRRLTPANLGAAAGLARALARSLRLVRRRRPAVVVGLGGYASVACGLAAAAWRVPLVVVEQNAVAGAANRLLARWARGAAVGFPTVDLPRAVWTGNPVRAEVLAVDRGLRRAEARAALGVGEDRFLVVALGGSLGARRINQAVVELAALWRGRSDLHVRHVAGRRDYGWVTERVESIYSIDGRESASASGPFQPGPKVESAGGGELGYDLVEYEDDMAAVYAAADLVVARSGASSVAELAAVGVPAVLVPLPGAPGDHQTANARALADAGGAVVVADGDLDGSRLAAEIDSLTADPGRLEAMGRAARTAARPDATEAVVDLIEKCARRPMPVAAEER